MENSLIAVLNHETGQWDGVPVWPAKPSIVGKRIWDLYHQTHYDLQNLADAIVYNSPAGWMNFPQRTPYYDPHAKLLNRDAFTWEKDGERVYKYAYIIDIPYNRLAIFFNHGVFKPCIASLDMDGEEPDWALLDENARFDQREYNLVTIVAEQDGHQATIYVKDDLVGQFAINGLPGQSVALLLSRPGAWFDGEIGPKMPKDIRDEIRRKGY